MSEWSLKVHKVTYRLKQENFVPGQTYIKYFNKFIDFYDESDSFYKIQLVYKEIFEVRERYAELIDINKEVLLSNDTILILARN